MPGTMMDLSLPETAWGAQQQEHGGEPDRAKKDPQKEGGVDRAEGRRRDAHEQETGAPDGRQRQQPSIIPMFSSSLLDMACRRPMVAG